MSKYMAVQRIALRVTFRSDINDDDLTESDSDRELFIELTQFLWEYGRTRGYC